MLFNVCILCFFLLFHFTTFQPTLLTLITSAYAIYENPKGASEGLLDKPSHKKLYEDFQMDDEMEIMKFILLKGDVKGVGTGSVAGSTRKDTGTSKGGFGTFP